MSFAYMLGAPWKLLHPESFITVKLSILSFSQTSMSAFSSSAIHALHTTQTLFSFRQDELRPKQHHVNKRRENFLLES